MPLRSLVVGLVLIVAGAAHAADRMSPVLGSPSVPGPQSNWDRVSAEPPVMRLVVGDRAPLFSYLGSDGKWHEFENLAARGSILLVFGANDSNLVEMERAQATFEDLGITPVAVVDMRSRSAAALGRRVGFSGPIITDPMRAIAELYNSLDPASLRHAPAFFVLDEERTIRALGRGWLPSVPQLLAVTAKVLGRPLPESATLLPGS